MIQMRSQNVNGHWLNLNFKKFQNAISYYYYITILIDSSWVVRTTL